MILPSSMHGNAITVPHPSVEADRTLKCGTMHGEATAECARQSACERVLPGQVASSCTVMGNDGSKPGALPPAAADVDATPQDALVRGIGRGDVAAISAAVAAGASVNTAGRRSDGGWQLPLLAALQRERTTTVRHLLAAGADANADDVMRMAVTSTSSTLLQALIDGGGDVNRASNGDLPLFTLLERYEDATGAPRLRLLLSQPDIDLTVTKQRMTPEQFARSRGKPRMAMMIRDEVWWWLPLMTKCPGHPRTRVECTGSIRSIVYDSYSNPVAWARLVDTPGCCIGTPDTLFTGHKAACGSWSVWQCRPGNAGAGVLGRQFACRPCCHRSWRLC